MVLPQTSDTVRPPVAEKEHLNTQPMELFPLFVYVCYLERLESRSCGAPEEASAETPAEAEEVTRRRVIVRSARAR